MSKPSLTSVLFLCLLVCLSSSPVLAQGGRTKHGPIRADSDQLEREPDDEAEGDNPHAREEWFRSGRRAAGEHAADLLHRAYSQKQSIKAQAASQQPATIFTVVNPGQNTANGIPFTGGTFPGTWTSLGPAPIASDPGQDYGKVVGRVTSVAVDQGDTTGNTVYVGAAFGGAWKSTNAADPDPTKVAWTALIDDQPMLAVGAITVQPGNSNVVLVGTGESNSSGDSYYGMGVLRSIDAGKTWSLIKNADNGAKTFTGLGASSFAWNGNTVVVGMGSTNGKRYGSDSIGGRGIYYSQDSGATWHYATVQDSPGAVLTEGTVTAVAFNPGTQKFYTFYRYHGFYESADGVTWTRSAAQPSSTGTLTVGNCPTIQPTPNPNGTCPLYRGQIAIQPVTHEMYVIYVNDSDIHQGVFVTANPATTPWREITSKGAAGLVDTVSNNAIVQGDYNLWIGAVPTQQGTDLLIGTRNVYRCSLTGNPADCVTTWKDLTHAYTCNPIANPSHVHPDQHGFDFSLNNPQQMYFGNDGGVYRSLNGANGDGSCNAQQVFDNLDANMGSLSEMVSFSQHPSNPNVLLAGLQDNGSPALLGSGAPLWQTVNGGDGGYNEIDPNNPDNIWYAAFNGVTIQQCDASNKQAAPNGPTIPSALACNAGTFGLPPYPSQTANIGPPQVAQDTSEFYMPYILDPANTANLIVATCRLWRGPGVGGGTWVDPTAGANKDISPMFDSAQFGGAATSCGDGSGSAAPTTKIRALAAGGPAPNGISQVIYVGLEGAGTATASGSNVGHVFVNTRADVNTGTHGAANGWRDVTANIAATFNTSGGIYGPYPVSSIEIDRHDATGQTAYLTVEGFGVAHVFKTTNAGTSWADISNNLPDAPADSIAIDPDDQNILYVGTDVGAFVSLNGGAAWQILGMNLPNVPVTKIRVFSNNAISKKLLRVSTYGRGAWEFALALPQPLSLSPGTLPAFNGTVQNATPAQTVTISNPGGVGASIAAINFSAGFSQSGGTCAVGSTLTAGANCTIPVVYTATSTNPTSGTLTVTDSTATTRSVSLSGTASDFALAAGASGTSQTVNAGQPATYNINVSGVNGFNGNVSFACTGGLPAAATCAFSPASAAVNGATPTAVTLTISTTAHSTAQPAPTAGFVSFPDSKSKMGMPIFLALLCSASLALLMRRKPGRGTAKIWALSGIIGAMMLMPACGGGGTTTTPSPVINSGTPAGTYTVAITATSGSRNIPMQLTLKVN